jgi:methionyl-tRNA formyltransferase
VDFFDTIYNAGITPTIVVTVPDKPAGRKMILTPPPLKVWAQKKRLTVLQPNSLKHDTGFPIQLTGSDLFIVVAYGKIIPQAILDIPRYGTVNLHPSLLPKYRGPSPIQSAILADDKQTGVSLMLLDAEMDHGPIIAQQVVHVDEWKLNRDMELWFAQIGSQMFIDVIGPICAGTQTYTEQNHDLATSCTKYEKEDMHLDLSKPREAFLKYCAFPKPFLFKDGQRIIVTEAEWKDKQLHIIKVIPEGKKEQIWTVEHYI